MPKPKIRVHTRQAVDLIRSGASDTVLKETFGLSSVGLRKLFKKLVDAKEIQQFELDRRAPSSHQSQTVSMSAILEEVLYDIDGNGNTSGSEIDSRKSSVDSTKKNQPTGIRAENRPKRLISGSEVAQFRIDEREGAYEQAEKDSPELVTLDFSLPEDDPWHRNSRKWTLSGLVEKHKVALAALAGGIVGMIVLVSGLLVFVGIERMPGLPKLPVKAASVPDEARSDGDKQVQEAMAILEAIARDRNDPAKSERLMADASYFEECLNNCKKSYSGVDDADKIELSNCRKECLHTHSELFKKMRQKYHGQTE